MSDQELNRIRRITGWSIVGLLVMIGVSIALSYYFNLRLQGIFYYSFLVPFHFGWLGAMFLIFIIFWVARWLFWPWRWNYRPYLQFRDDAHDILRQKYAKGEITKEQLEQMMHDLEQAGGKS